MLSSLKKTSDKAVGSGGRAWHPNFRNFERLPDTKAVRTSFFINGVAVLVAITLAIYTGYSEFGLHTVKADADAAQQSATESKPASDQAVQLYGKFQAEEKKVQALNDFLAVSPIVVSDLILKLGSGLPPRITINVIDYRGTSVGLRGGIEGAAEEASGLAAAYVETLRKNEEWKSQFETITLINLARDPGTGLIRFEIDMQFKSAAAKAKGGKK